MKPFLAGPTRNGIALDEVYTNMDRNIEKKHVQPPLQSIDGIESDHRIITASLKLPRQNGVVRTSFKFRPITVEGVAKFGELIASKDWEEVRCPSATESANALDRTLKTTLKSVSLKKPELLRAPMHPGSTIGLRR